MDVKKKRSKISCSKQSNMLPIVALAYGGDLRNKRKGRVGARTLSTKHSIHLVLRSTKAKGEMSFFKVKNKQKIKNIIEKHAHKNWIKLISVANVGNHLHLHIHLTRMHLYKPFIRAITGAIALTIMGANKNLKKVKSHKDRFWDYRPFTRLVTSFRQYLNMRDYMLINQLEGRGVWRANARQIVAYRWDRYGPLWHKFKTVRVNN